MAPARSFSRNILTLASGTAAAQILTLLAAPLMTRLYRPEEYGVFALWSVITACVCLLGSGKYDAAMLLPAEDHAAAALLYVSLGLSIVLAAVMAVVALTLGPRLAVWLGAPDLARWLLLVSPVVVVTNLCLSLSAWANRRQAYARLAACRLWQGIVQIAVNLGLGALGAGAVGLIAGVGVGQAVGVGLLGWQFWKVDAGCQGRPQWAGLRAQATRYAAFPRFTVWAEMLGLLSNQILTLLLPRLFGVTVVGWYAMGQRIVDVPSNLVGRAIGEVFRSRSSRDYAETGQCLAAYRETRTTLLAVGVLAFGTLLAVAPELFARVFGAEWRPAGEITRVLCLMYLVRFVVAPLTHTLILAGRQREDFWWQVAVTTASPLALGVAYGLTRAVMPTLLAFAVTYAVITGLYGWRSYRFAGGVGGKGARD